MAEDKLSVDRSPYDEQGNPHPLTVDRNAEGEVWVDAYVTVPELRRHGAQHGVKVPSKASKREIVEALRNAGLSVPRRPLKRPAKP